MSASQLMTDWDVAYPDVKETERVYVGRRFGGLGVQVTVIQGDQERPLPNVDSDVTWGFEWGYLGQGPKSLARSLLADHLGYQPTPLLAQLLLEEVVAHIPKAGFICPASHLADWIGRHLGAGVRG